MVSGFVFRTELCLQFGCGTELSQFVVGIGESRRVPFLARRLVLLVSLLAIAIELLAITDIEITGILLPDFATDEINTG